MASVDTAQHQPTPTGGAKPARGVGPARAVELIVWAWRMLASAQFAIALIGCLVVAGLLAVLLPQVPVQIRNNPAAIDAWLVLREDSFGPFTEPLHRMGLFNVVAAWWFLSALGLLAAAITVYVLDRFLDVWRNVTQPRRQVPDSFFERAANRVALPSAESGEAGARQIEAILSKRRFRVRRVARGDTVYLFADRFAWAQFGNFATHIALVLFLVGGLVSYLGGYTNALLIAEGTASPIFAVSHPNQMQIEVLDAVAAFDATGSPLDYRSELVIYQGGEEVARGTTTVNDPLLYGGYRFHQGGYFGEGAALRVRDVATGNTLYAEVLALTGLVPAPVIVVRDAGGNVLLDAAIVPTDLIEDVRGSLIAVPGTGREFWVGVRQDDEDGPGSAGAWSLVVFDRGQTDAGFVLTGGETLRADGLEWTFVEAIGLPALVSAGLPGDSDRTQTVLSQTPDGTPFVTVLGAVDDSAMTLFPDQPVVVDGREYVFEGRREFAGIEVRRDPGANLIWVAAGLLVAGLVVTFYLPRMRLWARVRDDEAVVAGLAERRGVFQSEAEHLRKELEAARMDGNPEIEMPGGDMND